ncbi:hypothetical protein LguiB_031717 [Lonicera macranthoides]
MANSRMARFVTDVAPPQFVSVVRHRASKMLDTINEEREVGANESSTLAPKIVKSGLLTLKAKVCQEWICTIVHAEQ